MVENDNADNAQEFMQEQVNKVFEFWSSKLKLPTIGPTYAFSKDFSSFANDFVTLGKAMIELKSNMDIYSSLLSAAYKGNKKHSRASSNAAGNKRRF
jgi:hypothetical protein